jgi:hypothetical protein
MADLLEELKARTVAGVQPVRGLNYNYPQRLFMKPDGTVVSLQGDPQNRAYYRDKGYIELSEVRPPAGGLSERQRYEQEFRPALIAAQREKAEVINTIRRIGQHNPSLNVDYPWETLSTAQCREIMDGLSAKTTEPPPAEDRLLTGVETAATASLEGLQAKLANPQGYDPIDQAARPVRQRIPHGPS